MGLFAEICGGWTYRKSLWWGWIFNAFLAFLFLVCGVEDDAEGAEEARVWEEYERTMDAETFAFWRDERLDLATSAALADVDGDGVHLMPVTEEGYAGVARLADTIQALASARSS